MKNSNFFAELKRRNVYKVAIAYAIVGWLLIQGASIFFPTFDAPPWVIKVFIAIVVLGFPAALVLTWALDITPEGLKRTKPAETNSASLPELPEKSIAVLPFENLSEEAANAFFVDGLHDEILSDLARIADLKVISRTSVMQYKTAATRNLRAIASELGVAHVLEGSVQRSGNRIRLRAQLIDARTDVHLWAEKFDRPLDDVFAIQSEIAKAVAEQLRAKLSPAERAAIEQQPTANLFAYDRYLRGKKLAASVGFDAREVEYYPQAVRLLNQAIAHDPTFLLAYCQLANAHDMLYFVGLDHTPARLALAHEALAKALQLGPDRGEPHLAAARVFYHCYRDYEKALAELAIARRKLPNDSYVFELSAAIARRQGQWQQCTSNYERAAELDPQNIFLFQQITQTYVYLRRYSDAVRTLDRALAVAPNDAPTRVARALIELDWHAETQPAYETIQEVVTEDPSAADAIAEQWLYLALCRRDWTELARALASIPPEGIIPVNVRMPRNFCEGLAARARGDAPAGEAAFAGAREEMEKLLHEQPDYAEALSILGMSDAALRRTEEAVRAGRRAAELFPVTKDAVMGAEILRNLAITYAWAGEKDLALKQLEELVRIYSPISYGQLKLHPWWDPLREHPRFSELVAEARNPVVVK
jgi:TolB-like protein/Flp pilus assembly protein TadD